MSDLNAINEAINKRAGRRLIPSILVGLFLVGIVFATMAFARPLFAIFVTGAILLALRELCAALVAHGTRVRFPLLALATIGLQAGSWFGGLPGLAITLVVTTIAILFRELLAGTEGFVRSASASAFALFYPGFVAGFILLLARSGDGYAYIVTLLFIVGMNDTFAYLTGLLIGRHPMAPKISPKKTWEGFIGGLVATVGATAVTFHYLLEREYLLGALAGALGVLAATAGDLIESAIKRDLSLKDMGTLLPGHGGMLDRLDSALITAPIFWCVIELLKRFG